MSEDIEKAINDFTFDYIRSLGLRTNVIFSPTCIFKTLGMIALGSCGKTYAQFASLLLGIQNSREEDKEKTLKKLASYIEENYDLNLTSKLFTSKDTKDSYKELVRSIFKGDIQKVNFSKPDHIEKEVDRWIHHETKGKIKEIPLEQEITNNTVLLGISALYFHINWKDEFDKRSTEVATFFLLDGSKVRTNFMNGRVKCHAYEDLDIDSRVICLPYKNSRLRALAILPNKRDGIRRVVEKVEPRLISRWLRNYELLWRSIKLPLLSMQFCENLSHFLSEKGKINRAFASKKADFCDISREPLFLSSVFHACLLEVTEEGTTAAATTAAISATTTSFHPEEFIFDHPFLFAVFDVDKKIPHIFSVIMDPSK